MSEQPGFQLLISTFGDDSTALKAVTQLLDQFAGQSQAMPAVASVVKTAAGELTIQENSDIGGKQGAAAGALAGGLVGLLSRRRGVVSSAALGALLGGVVAHKVDTGIPDPRLEAIGEALDKATSAAVAIISETALPEAKTLLAGLGGSTVMEPFDHKTDFIKQVQSGDYSGALTALANQAEGGIAGASGSIKSVLDRNTPS